MQESVGVVTEVEDLSGLKLSELLDQDSSRFADTLRRLRARVGQPSRSISGYNPQRLD
ncbi:hypothetical protein ACIBSW_11390 [Actinoplanes sp. NPDC049668]|uniref:hypothetical protein n=1 Tax=unclassified Actinoplanes TaxID=2626549 RepID=UPI0033A74B00